MSNLTVTIYHNVEVIGVSQVNSMQDALNFLMGKTAEKYYKFDVIVTDSNGNEYGRFYFPYEGMSINSAMSNPLKEIQNDYQIPDEIFRTMIEKWVNNNE